MASLLSTTSSRGGTEGGTDLFFLVSGDRMQGNGLKLHQGEVQIGY